MFHEVIFPHFGTPRMVISDEGSHFIDKTFRAFKKELGAKHNIATPYHPQTSGLVETSNKQIKIYPSEKDGKTSYLMHSRHIGWLTKLPLACHHSSSSMERVVTYQLSSNTKLTVPYGVGTWM